MNRNNGKTMMLLLAVLAIGMFALPSTLAMYSGQHQFTNGSNVDCNRCHGSNDTIYEELRNGDAHRAMTCKNCHGFSNSTIVTPNADDGTLGHAATVGVSCIDCHVNGTYDVGSDDGDGITVVNEITAGTEAHKDMYSYFRDVVGDPDDACIACHTQAAMSSATSNITYAPNQTMVPLSTWTYGNGGV